MRDMRQQFSLDYLSGDKEKRYVEGTTGSKALEEALVVYSQPIIEQLSAADKQQKRVHDLVQAVSEKIRVHKFEEFLGVIDSLAALKFIEIVHTDCTGNHLIHLLRSPK